MASTGEEGCPGETSGRCGADDDAGAGQNLEFEEGTSRKRKAAVMCWDANSSFGNGEGLKVECEGYQRISMELENLRTQLDEELKELEFCDENEKLRVEMDLKDKNMQCLRKQNEMLQAKYKELQIKYEKQNEELQAKYERRKEFLARYEKQMDELQGKDENDMQSSYKNQKEELLAEYENEELQPKHDRLLKNFLKTLENQIDAKRKQLQQLKGLYSIMEFPLTQLMEGKRIPDKLYNEGSNYKLVDESSAENRINWKADDDDDEKLKKQRLELEVAESDAEIEIKMEKLGEMLVREKFSEELSSVTVWKYIQTNMELQEIRKGLIKGLEDVPLRYMNIGIKRMGEIKYLPLRNACQQRFGKYDAEVSTALLFSVWSEELGKPSWHPFKIVETHGRLEEVINDDDSKLKFLRNEFGGDVCDAVKTALMEMNEYNPSERQVVPEFWNFGKCRKATVGEILMFVFSHLHNVHWA